jgi:hypothetical protein
MKYAKELDATLRSLPWYIRPSFISYRAWKKWNFADETSWKESLMRDCAKCDRLYRITRLRYSNNTETLNQYAEINKRTLYKICKRLQKRYDVDSLRFYRLIIKGEMFHFLGTYSDVIN